MDDAQHQDRAIPIAEAADGVYDAIGEHLRFEDQIGWRSPRRRGSTIIT